MNDEASILFYFFFLEAERNKHEEVFLLVQEITEDRNDLWEDVRIFCRVRRDLGLLNPLR